MAGEDRSGQGTVANGATVRAEVNGGRLVHLWRIDGRSAYVEPDEVQSYLSEGWSLQPADPEALAGELGPRFAAARRAVEAFYQGVKKDGKIDGSDEAQHSAAVRAMEELTSHVGRLLEVIGLTVPAAQAPTEEAEGVQFDPSQVLVETAEGRVIAVARTDVTDKHKVLARGKAAEGGDAGDNNARAADDLGPGANDAIGPPPELVAFHAEEARAKATGDAAPEAPRALVNQREVARGRRARR